MRAAPTTAPTLRLGSRGSPVRTLQSALAHLTYMPGSAVDGVFGMRTLHAVVAFQGWSGLVRDGVLGPKTRGGAVSAVVIAAVSGASWLDRSSDGGRRWRTVLTYGDGGAGWADLGFTSALDGAVIHAPAPLTSIGQLLLTDDGGRTWRATSFTGHVLVRRQVSRVTRRSLFTTTEER